jgi:recombination protein RecA
MSLSKLVASMKKAGKNVFIASEAADIKYLVTPSLNLNKALNGGFSCGRIIEIAGESGTGKTSLCLQTIAAAQKADPDFNAVWVDTENDWDSRKAREVFGIDTDRLIVVEQGYAGAEEVADIIESFIATKEVHLVVVNSVAAFAAKSELDAANEKASIGLLARFVSKLMRKLNAAIQETGTTLILINQYRTNIGGWIHAHVKVLKLRGYLT